MISADKIDAHLKEFVTGWGGHTDAFFDENDTACEHVEPIKAASGTAFNMYMSDGAIIQVVIDRINDVAEPGSTPDPGEDQRGEWHKENGEMVWFPYEEGE